MTLSGRSTHLLRRVLTPWEGLSNLRVCQKATVIMTHVVSWSHREFAVDVREISISGSLPSASLRARFRAQMVKAGLIPKLVELLKRPPYRARGLRLLYHMSIDDRCKAMFAYTDVSHAVCTHSFADCLDWRFWTWDHSIFQAGELLNQAVLSSAGALLPKSIPPRVSLPGISVSFPTHRTSRVRISSQSTSEHASACTPICFFSCSLSEKIQTTK